MLYVAYFLHDRQTVPYSYVMKSTFQGIDIQWSLNPLEALKMTKCEADWVLNHYRGKSFAPQIRCVPAG